MEEWEKKSRGLRKEAKIIRNVKQIFFWFVDIHGKLIKIQFHEPTKFKTKNRKDIDLTVEFLKDVLEHKIPIDETKFFKLSYMTGDSAENHKLHLKHILDLYEEIKQNGIKKPLIIAKYNSPTIKIWHWLNGKKVWKDFKNDTGFQLIEGTHRLPIAIYLNFKEIPVKIYKPIFTQVPNFTEYYNNKG